MFVALMTRMANYVSAMGIEAFERHLQRVTERNCAFAEADSDTMSDEMLDSVMAQIGMYAVVDHIIDVLNVLGGGDHE